MTFLAPWAAWFAAGIPVIILLYLLKLKRRSAGVSTLMFWQQVLRETRRRALFQRLRRLLSLLLHLLIFLLILAALARPEMGRLIHSGASIVIVVDTRARMQAINSTGRSDFAESLRLTGQSIRHAGTARQIALIAADGAADVIVPFTGDELALQQGLARLAVTDAGGELDSAIRLADDLLASRNGSREIIVLTNEACPSNALIRSPMRIEHIGNPRNNLAITNFAARALPNSPQTSQVLLTVQNFGHDRVRGNVEIALDDRVIDVKPFDIEPGAHQLEIASLVPPNVLNARGQLTAKLDTHDALAADDIAYATLPSAHRRRVLLVTPGNFFLEKLLSAEELIESELLTPEAYRADLARSFDSVIFDNFVPSDFDLAEAQGNFLFLEKSPFASVEIVEAPPITDIDRRNPLLRLVNLQNVTILNARIMSLPQAAAGWRFEAPLRSVDHPLILTGTRRIDPGEQRMAAFAFDIAKSDLPLRVAFPLLISNTLQWLSGEDVEPHASVRAGEMITLSPGQTIAMAGGLVENIFRPLHNGFYFAQRGDRQDWIAVNTFSAAQSDLIGSAADATSQLTARPAAAIIFPTLLTWDWWIYLTLAAFTLFAWEWWLFHRRATE